MNMKHQISITSLVFASVLATGCSQQQVQEAPAEPVAAVAAVVAPVAAPVANPDCHTHPRNAMTNSVKHCHKNPKGHHHYGAAKPAVDVSALQRKLKAKGYYKGAIDGVINDGTRDALKKYQNR
jgi:PBP1b-binding outer membrane lipoprotein LpoB